MKKNNVFEDVAEAIAKKVEDGSYGSSQKLPSEYDLAKEFDVSRLTVRKAIDFLIAQNILVKHKGKGTYIMTQSSKFQSGRDGLLGFTESAKAYGKTSTSEIITFNKTTDFPKQVKELLGIHNEQIYHIIRLRYFNKEPMVLEELFIKESYLPLVEKQDVSGSLFKLIEEKIDISYSHQEVEATLVNDTLSKHLDLPVGDPILLVHTVTYSASGIPILFDQSYYRADKYTFKTILHRPSL